MSDEGWNGGLIGTLMDWLGRWGISDFLKDVLRAICHQFALGVTNRQHLLWVKVLNIVDVLSVFYPFAPNAQQAARCQVLDNFFHK